MTPAEKRKAKRKACLFCGRRVMGSYSNEWGTFCSTNCFLAYGHRNAERKKAADREQILGELQRLGEAAIAKDACESDHPEHSPIPMRLTCPACMALHVDEGDFATRSHHTHACQACGNVWRPAIVPTVGVRFLPGFKNP